MICCEADLLLSAGDSHHTERETNTSSQMSDCRNIVVAFASKFYFCTMCAHLNRYQFLLKSGVILLSCQKLVMKQTQPSCLLLHRLSVVLQTDRQREGHGLDGCSTSNGRVPPLSPYQNLYRKPCDAPSSSKRTNEYTNDEVGVEPAC